LLRLRKYYGCDEMNPYDNVAYAIHMILAATAEVIVEVSKENGKVMGMRQDGVNRPRTVELHWDGITVIVEVRAEPNPLSMATVMPVNASKDLSERLHKVAEIVAKVNIKYGGDGVPRFDYRE